MNQSKVLINAFQKTAIGRVISGREAFRNRMGRLLHGLTYYHPKSLMTIGAVAFMAGITLPGVLLASAPLMFVGVYSAISPKKTEKAACEFLANVAIRKTDALAHFLKKQQVTTDIAQSTLQQYLEQNLPRGMANEYMSTHPNAIVQIQSEHASDICYHNPEVYLLEVLQEQLTKSQDKGGILHGMMQTFMPKYYLQEKEARRIAAIRWSNRQLWEKMAKPKPTWPVFMHAAEHPKPKQKQLQPAKTVLQTSPTVTLKKQNATGFNPNSIDEGR